MKKITGILALLILVACSANKFDVELVASLPPSVDHVVAFAVVDFNPTEKFVKEYNSANQKAAPEASTNESGKNALIINSLMTNWDELFKDIPATDYFLMNSADSVNYSKTGGIFVPLADNWWVMSKSFLIDGNPYCYVVKLEIKKGSKISCRPNKSNLVSLTEIYQKQMQKQH